MIPDTAKKKVRSSPLLFLIVIVALALTIAAVSIPNLMRSRVAANEASAVGSMRTINTALVTYSAEHPGEGYPQRLSDLAPYIDPVLATGLKSGYNFRYLPDTPDVDGVVKSFRVDAAPISTQAGVRLFSTNQNGQINYRASLQEPEKRLGDGAPQETQPQRTGPGSRRVTRQTSFNLIVTEPFAAGEKIRALAYRLGGYVESMRSSDYGAGTKETTMAIRVPADRFEEARREVRGLGKRVNNEQDDGRDVTVQYVDLESQLRNFRVEETQYLEIMRRSGTIKDTLAVSERLADVRGRIERIQGQLNLLAHQTEMALLEVNLRTEPATPTVDVHWRPVAEIKAAFWSAADDLSTYANFMIAVLFRLPVFALWTLTALISFFGGWRLLRWTRKRFVPSSIPAA